MMEQDQCKLHNSYVELLQNVYGVCGRKAVKSLTLFPGLASRNAPKKLLVVGRAINGVRRNDRAINGVRRNDEEWELKDLSCEREVRSKVDKAMGKYKKDDNENPLDWVRRAWYPETRDNYNTRRSAFYRVVRSMVKELGIADVNGSSWLSPIACSNLYKISPANGGNPSGVLLQSQIPACTEILKQEIELWQPERVLFLTGRKYAGRFLDELDFKSVHVDDKFIGKEEMIGGYLSGFDRIMKAPDVVVASHPQGKPEKKIIEFATRFFQSRPRK